MKATPSKASPSKKTVTAKQPPKTAQQLFDKWLLPFLFVAIGIVIVWSIYRGVTGK